MTCCLTVIKSKLALFGASIARAIVTTSICQLVHDVRILEHLRTIPRSVSKLAETIGYLQLVLVPLSRIESRSTTRLAQKERYGAVTAGIGVKVVLLQTTLLI